MTISLLDTDFYKFTMQQIVFHRFADAKAEHQFFCRTPKVNFSRCVEVIREKVAELCQLTLSSEEIAYLRSLQLFQDDYLQFLQGFSLDANAVTVDCIDGQLSLRITGSWLNTILFETPLLSIINESYFAAQYPELDWQAGEERLQAKIDLLKGEIAPGQLQFVDFGTRRRFSFAWQEKVLSTLQQQCSDYCIGTSNVFSAKKLGLKPIGTMAHEYIQAMQAIAPDLRESQRYAFQQWLDEYGQQLAIALSDTYNTDVFLQDFDKAFCEAYAGVRQDSGDPFLFADRFIAHLQQMGIDPKQKQIIFSDSLTFEKMIGLQKTFAEQIQVAFGIGTNLLNDMGANTINIVIKMTSCNGQPVAKISNNPEKIATTDAAYIDKLRKTFAL